MFAIWFLGLLSVLVYRAVYAGMRYEILCDKPSDYELRYTGKKPEDLEINGGKVFEYIFISGAIALFWMLVLPVYGLFRLGRKIGKKKSEHPKES